MIPPGTDESHRTPATPAQHVPATASVRRADWRFLLPTPPTGSFERLVLLGARPGLTELVLERGVAREVHSTIVGQGIADALVILAGARVPIDRATACLRPGGVLYVEVDRRAAPLATPGRVRNALRNVGIAPTGTYWARPGFERCRMFLPLDLDGPLNWYVSTLYTAPTPVHTAFEVGIRLLTGLKAKRFSALVPCFVVTGVAAPAATEWLPSVLGHPDLTQLVPERRLFPVLLTGGSGDWSRVTMLPFAAGERQPRLVLKVTRFGQFEQGLVDEQSHLEDVRSRLDDNLRETVPLPLGLFRQQGTSVAVERSAEGAMMARTSGRWWVPPRFRLGDLLQAAEWIEALHEQAVISRGTWDDAAVHHWVHAPLVEYAHSFGETPAELRLFSAARARARQLVDRAVSFPIVSHHNDFGDWNILRDRAMLTVLDWEVSRPGPPLCDLLYFVTTWSHTVQSLRNETARLRDMERLFFGPAPTDAASAAIHRVVEHYLQRLRLDPDFLPLLHVYTAVEQALDRARRLEALGQRHADPRENNPFLGWVAVLSRHTEQMFGLQRGSR